MPTQAQASKAVERLLEEILRIASDADLEDVPAPEDMVGVLRFQRKLAERVVPRDQVLRDRATVTRYLRDVLDREDLATLRTMQRARMKGKDQSSAFGWEAPTSARSRRVALEKVFSSARRSPGGQVLRTARPSSVESRPRVDREAQNRWIAGSRGHLMRVAERLIEVCRRVDASESNQAFLADLEEEIVEADTVTGDWTYVLIQLHVVCATTEAAALSATDRHDVTGPVAACRAMLLAAEEAGSARAAQGGTEE